jgi:hypothetical protein
MQIAAENRLGGLGAGRGRRDENRRYRGLALITFRRRGFVSIWICVGGGAQQLAHFCRIDDEALVFVPFRTAHGDFVILITHGAGYDRLQAGVHLADAGALHELRHITALDAAGGP